MSKQRVAPCQLFAENLRQNCYPEEAFFGNPHEFNVGASASKR
jgi:hypothetical protein